MINFFRRIRHRLVKENRVIKYLLYAIGEIALVVIGILIALQVNNWNESRKLNNERKELISQMIIEMDTTISRMDQSIAGINKKLFAGMKFMEAAPFGGIPAQIDSLKLWATTASSNWDVEPQLTSYTGAIASGKIGLIKEKGILESYAVLLQFYEKFKRHQNILADMYYKGAGWEVRKQIGDLQVLTPYDDPIPGYHEELTDAEFRELVDKPEVFALFQNIWTIQNNMLAAFEGMQAQARTIRNKLTLKVNRE